MLRAYIDESGITPHGDRTTEYFVLTAVVFDDADGSRAQDLLAALRQGAGRGTAQRLHFNQMTQHGLRRYLTEELGRQDWLTISTVVVCKRLIKERIEEPFMQYAYTFRYLLERLSWLARDRKSRISVVASEVGQAPQEQMDGYMAALYAKRRETSIAWNWVLRNVRVMPADGDERLQLADIAASATAAAFEPDRWSFTEAEYFRNLLARLYRSPDGRLAGYGLKIHPAGAETLPAYADAVATAERLESVS